MTDEPRTDRENPLTAGEWAALLYSATASNQKMIYRLAIHHGVVEPDPAKECPLCGAQSETHTAPKQARLIP